LLLLCHSDDVILGQPSSPSVKQTPNTKQSLIPASLSGTQVDSRTQPSCSIREWGSGCTQPRASVGVVAAMCWRFGLGCGGGDVAVYERDKSGMRRQWWWRSRARCTKEVER